MLLSVKACALQRQLGLVQQALFVQLMQQLQLHQLLVYICLGSKASLGGYTSPPIIRFFLQPRMQLHLSQCSRCCVHAAILAVCIADSPLC